MLENKKVKIDYPLFWEYKVIFEVGKNENEILNEILKNFEHKIELSKNSSNGKYVSYNVFVFVKDEKERLEVFENLKTNAKFVL